MKINLISMDFCNNNLTVSFENSFDMKEAYNHFINPAPSPAELRPINLNQIDFALRGLLRAGEKILAIKLVRTVSSLGLLEAKKYVEALDPTDSW